MAAEIKKKKTNSSEDWLKFLNLKDFQSFTKKWEDNIPAQRISFNPYYLYLRDEVELIEILSTVVASSENAKTSWRARKFTEKTFRIVRREKLASFIQILLTCEVTINAYLGKMKNIGIRKSSDRRKHRKRLLEI